jgi:hypothetical protein
MRPSDRLGGDFGKSNVANMARLDQTGHGADRLIGELLKPGKRQRDEARARIRALLAMEALVTDEVEISEKDIDRIEKGVKAGKKMVERPLWDDVQAVLAANRVERATGARARHPSLLTGMVFDETGERLTPTYAVKKGTRYRYYVSTSLLAGAGSPRFYFLVCENPRHSRGLGWRAPVSGRQFLVFRSWTGGFRAPVSARHFSISVSAWLRPVRYLTETGSRRAPRLSGASSARSSSPAPVKSAAAAIERPGGGKPSPKAFFTRASFRTYTTGRKTRPCAALCRRHNGLRYFSCPGIASPLGPGFVGAAPPSAPSFAS